MMPKVSKPRAELLPKFRNPNLRSAAVFEALFEGVPNSSTWFPTAANQKLRACLEQSATGARA
jgi:hypothetical protein